MTIFRKLIFRFGGYVIYHLIKRSFGEHYNIHSVDLFVPRSSNEYLDLVFNLNL